jgi:beta-xylosidase
MVISLCLSQEDEISFFFSRLTNKVDEVHMCEMDAPDRRLPAILAGAPACD